MEVRESSLSGLPVLTVTGDVDHLTVQGLEASVQKTLGANGKCLLVDLADCPYLDSAGLSVLLCAVREVKGKGWVGVIAPRPNLVRLFEIVGLNSDPDFHIFSSPDEAAAALEA